MGAAGATARDRWVIGAGFGLAIVLVAVAAVQHPAGTRDGLPVGVLAGVAAA